MYVYKEKERDSRRCTRYERPGRGSRSRVIRGKEREPGRGEFPWRIEFARSNFQFLLGRDLHNLSDVKSV